MVGPALLRKVETGPVAEQPRRAQTASASQPRGLALYALPLRLGARSAPPAQKVDTRSVEK